MSTTQVVPASTLVPRWMRVCGWTAVAAALPTVVWRVVVGLGVNLGTPTAWRQAEHIPGSGTTYVLGLSIVQLCAALLTLVLIRREGDRIPTWLPLIGGHRLSVTLIIGGSATGIAALTFLCVASAIHWGNVDPFRGEPAAGWAWLCWTSYAVTPLWPMLLAATTIGYAALHNPGCSGGLRRRSRRSQ